MTTPLPQYAVIADTHVGLDESSTRFFGTRDRAVEDADRENRDAEAAGVPLHYRVFVLRELDDSQMWDWGHRLRATGQVVQYVHERAARNCAYDGATVVRRRAGTDEWEEAGTP